MDPFSIQIAGLVTHISPLFASTREFCRNYLTELEAECFVEVTKDDLSYSQKLLEMEAVEEGIRVRKFPEPFLERSTILRKIARELLNRDTLMLHGSTIAVDGAAYLFTAPCGTGKSTHTRLWREVFGSRAVMVNDDKPFLKVTSSSVLAYGAPWSGKHGLDNNICVPLKGICFLHRGLENRIWKASVEDSLEELKHQCQIPEDPSGQEKAIALVDALSKTVPLWEMTCTKDIEAAYVAFRAMSGNDVSI